MSHHHLAPGGNVKDFSGVVDHQALMLPSVPLYPHQHSPLDSKRTPITTESRTTYIGFPGCDTGCSEDAGGDCYDGVATTSSSDRAMLNYVKNKVNPGFAVGDVIDIVQLSRFTTMDKLFWSVEKPIAPFTFDLQIAELKEDGTNATVSSLATYNPDGSILAAAGTAITPLVIATGLSGEVAHWHIINMINPVTLLPYQVRTNEMLQLVIRSMPPDPAPNACGGCCACGGLSGLGLLFAPNLTSYHTGL